MLKKTYRARIGRGAAFLLSALLLTSFILACGSPAQTASQSKSAPVSPTSTPTATPTVKVNALPTPLAKPIVSTGFSGNSLQVVVANGVVYAGTVNNGFYAVRASDGKLLWHAKVDGSVGETPVLAGGVIYVSTYVGQSGPANLYALRASDGRQLWVYPASNDYVSPPVVAGGLAYLETSDGVVALRANNGTQAWHYASGSNTFLSSVVNGVLYLSSHTGDTGPGTAFAVRASDGSLLWSYKSTKTLDPPEIINGIAYVEAWDGTLYALQASNGKSLWQTALSGSSLWMQQVNDTLYIAAQKVLYTPTSSTGLAPQIAAASQLLSFLRPSVPKMPHKQVQTSLYALRTGNGAVLWHKELNNGQDSFANWFVLDNGVIYGTQSISGSNNTNQGYVYAMQASDGSPVWKDKVQGSPGDGQIINGVIYATSGDSSAAGATALYALREHDGSLLWSYPIYSDFTGTPMQVGNTLYTSAGNGMLYALSANNGKLLWHYQTDTGA